MPEQLEMAWRYDLGEVTQDRRVKKAYTKPGFCPLIVGADMRVQGGLRPFPGFKHIHRLGVGMATGDSAYTVTSVNTGDFWPVTLQVESVGSLSGYVFRATVGGVVKIIFEYYDSIGVDKDTGGSSLSGTGWRTVTLVSGAGTAAMDVVVFGRLLYVFRKGSEPTLFYIYLNGSDYTEKLATDTGPGPTPEWSNGNLQLVTPLSNVPAPLDPGQYTFAYQLYDSKTGRLSQLSRVLAVAPEQFGPERPFALGVRDGTECPTVAMSPTGFFDNNSFPACPFELRRPQQGASVSGLSPGSQTGIFGKYDQIKFYRSISVDAAGTAYSGTVLFLDHISNLIAPGILPSTYYELTDLALMYKFPYNNKAFFDADMPFAGAAGILNGVLFTGPDGAATSALSNVGEIRWSSLSDVCVELFPPDNRSVPQQVNDEVIRFVRAGDAFVGFSRSRHYYVFKAGTVVTIRDMHEGYGITGPRAACAVGPLIYLVTPQGFVSLDPSGALVSINAIDELVMGDWAEDVQSLVAVYDPPMGLLSLLNPTTEEMVCFWMTTRSVCQQVHCSFKGAGAGLVPNGSGVNATQARAQFVTNGGVVMRIDDQREKTVGGESRFSLFDVDGTDVNVAASSGSGTSVVVQNAYSIGTTPATDVVSLREAKIYWTSGANKGSVYTISSVSGQTITLASSLAAAVANGDTFVISPVFFRCQLWPLTLQAPDGTQQGNDQFRRKIIRGIGTVWGDVNGPSFGEDAATYSVRVYKGMSDTAAVEGQPLDPTTGVAPDGGTIVEGLSPVYSMPSTTVGARFGGVSGGILLPEVQVVVGDLDWRLMAVTVKGTIEASDKDTK